MKTIRHLVLALFALLATVAAFAAKPIPGPKGGKILTAEAPHVEFFVGPDRTVVVSLYDKDLKLIVPSGQVVSAVAEAKRGKTNLVFTPREGVFVSSTPLPEGEGYRVVLQVRAQAEVKPKNYRIDFHDEICGGCQRAEYACTCDDHGHEAGGHQH